MHSHLKPTGATYQIGIVEDDILYANNLETYLRQEKAFSICLKTNSIKQTIEYFNSPLKVIPDLMLLDIHLPGQLGSEAIALIKKFNPNMMVVMMTLEDSKEMIHASFENGADGYLLKTESLSVILNQLINMLHFKQPAISYEAFRSMLPKGENNLSAGMKNLTPKEAQIAQLVIKGFSAKKIADELKISSNTISYHMKNIYQKLNINTRVELVIYAKKND